MKKAILISITLIFLGLSVNAQSVTKSNIMNYVESFERSGNHGDGYWIRVEFTDGKTKSIFYNEDEGYYYDSTTLMGVRIGSSKREASWWTYCWTHNLYEDGSKR